MANLFSFWLFASVFSCYGMLKQLLKLGIHKPDNKFPVL